MFRRRKKEKEMKEIKKQVSRPIVPDLPKTMPEIETLPMRLDPEKASPFFLSSENYKQVMSHIDTISSSLPFLLKYRTITKYVVKIHIINTTKSCILDITYILVISLNEIAIAPPINMTEI